MAGTTLFSVADAYGLDGDSKATARWGVSQYVSPQSEIDDVLTQAGEQVCSDRNSDACRIGGSALAGVYLTLGLSGPAGTAEVVRRLAH